MHRRSSSLLFSSHSLSLSLSLSQSPSARPLHAKMHTHRRINTFFFPSRQKHDYLPLKSPHLAPSPSAPSASPSSFIHALSSRLRLHNRSAALLALFALAILCTTSILKNLAPSLDAQNPHIRPSLHPPPPPPSPVKFKTPSPVKFKTPSRAPIGPRPRPRPQLSPPAPAPAPPDTPSLSRSDSLLALTLLCSSPSADSLALPLDADPRAPLDPDLILGFDIRADSARARHELAQLRADVWGPSSSSHVVVFGKVPFLPPCLIPPSFLSIFSATLFLAYFAPSFQEHHPPTRTLLQALADVPSTHLHTAFFALNARPDARVLIPMLAHLTAPDFDLDPDAYSDSESGSGSGHNAVNVDDTVLSDLDLDLDVDAAAAADPETALPILLVGGHVYARGPDAAARVQRLVERGVFMHV